ncbi:hypothetical protein QRD89_05650 [Halobacillus sp. ACCC02827]|uniref:hypothetical protein n=1 Tax=Bacillaceae TaxID=186817 RepID=UPI00055173E8|nr:MULTISPECIES: hypothetical protein [Bacillaceae]QHT46019.1 hypothetical protein M662_05775 [Bacillus sp. SB49]WJE16832.1 hypothetical protein QRD89_05650 [Halobacillus sp. ACCC02827]
MIRWGLFIGTTSGIVLGLYLWFVEQVTGMRVYTLLMNVDFIPVLGDIDWPVFMEWFFHILISWAIGIIYAYLLMYRLRKTNRNRWLLAVGLTLFAAFTYVPLTILAVKETPGLTDGAAITQWLIGHALYAITLKMSFSRFRT